MLVMQENVYGLLIAPEYSFHQQNGFREFWILRTKDETTIAHHVSLETDDDF